MNNKVFYSGDAGRVNMGLSGDPTYPDIALSPNSGGNTMSLAVLVQGNGVGYIAADSRITHKDEEDNDIGVSDDYQKIVKIPIKRPVYAVVTGLSIFNDGQTLKELVNSVEFNEQDDNYVICHKLLSGITRFPKQVYMMIASYGSNGIELSTGTNAEQGMSYFDLTVPLDRNFRSGSELSTSYIDSHPIEVCDILTTINLPKATVIANINKAFEACIKEDVTVGGPIRILKLTPDGAEWLQNKPE